MKIKCLLVDDEPPAIDLIAAYIDRMDDLEVAGRCSNAIDAFGFLQKNRIDLLFLDINMPRMSGLDLIRSLQDRPRIVLTTAYREFAADGFDLDVLDYLVKPISFDRFLKAIAKFNQLHSFRQTEVPEQLPDGFDKAYMYFKVNKEVKKIFLRDILYIESIKDYVKIVTADKALITYQRLSYMEEKLPEHKFLRVHKSFIVSADRIAGYNNDVIRVGEHSLPLGRSYKQSFLKFIAHTASLK
ncbi:MAG: LytTR family DNA-binding domain-containing protein [Candidatus Pseudobacter hemicellulosilyticus]|uniref:LytTR family DNA-binding domain-containing protein n=1 Tax=Candidatus Pseudobacter hemicellulosilyticus TaxID=3121375 RepID=A0AAJ6BHH8_9BACT|nr:MAG: LytTR family DNA-binding domain-containing protein [Pseudobacter sp.]